jgi:hypothetical protein
MPELLPELRLGSRYFLGLSRESSGDLRVSDPNMELRIESSQVPLLTQGGLFLPIEAPDDINAVWSLSWPYLSQGELDQLEGANRAGLVTIDDPLFFASTGYITNLSYTALPGIVDDTGGNVYQVSAEFHASRMVWPSYVPLPFDGSYASDSGFGFSPAGSYALKAPNGIDVVDQWFLCRVSPHGGLQLPSLVRTPDKGSLYFAFQTLAPQWRPGNAGSERLLFGALSGTSSDPAALIWRVTFEGTQLLFRVFQGGVVKHQIALNASAFTGAPDNAHYVIGIGYEHLGTATRISLGLAMWSSGSSGIVFEEQRFGNWTHERYLHGAINLAGALQIGMGARVRPIEGRFHSSSYLTQGALSSLITKHLVANELL